jgi:hypothetical protein
VYTLDGFNQALIDTQDNMSLLVHTTKRLDNLEISILSSIPSGRIFYDCEIPQGISLPLQWDSPLISHKSQLRYNKTQYRLQHNHKYMVCTAIYIDLISQSKASSKHNIYIIICKVRIKPIYAKEQVTFDVNKLSTCCRKEKHWIYESI